MAWDLVRRLLGRVRVSPSSLVSSSLFACCTLHVGSWHAPRRCRSRPIGLVYVIRRNDHDWSQRVDPGSGPTHEDSSHTAKRCCDCAFLLWRVAQPGPVCWTSAPSVMPPRVLRHPAVSVRVCRTCGMADSCKQRPLPHETEWSVIHCPARRLGPGLLPAWLNIHRATVSARLSCPRPRVRFLATLTFSRLMILVFPSSDGR